MFRPPAVTREPHGASARLPALLATLLTLAATLAACGQTAPTPSSSTGPAPSDPAGASAEPTTAAAPACTDTASAPDRAWWSDRVFYEVFVRSFQDSDGDGIGDLAGLTSRLDYLNDGDAATTEDLGVTAIWLMPVAESPSYHGYDVADYRTVETDYGTADDFRAFVEAAHDRGIKVIVDLVINHTSREYSAYSVIRGLTKTAAGQRRSASAHDIAEPMP